MPKRERSDTKKAAASDKKPAEKKASGLDELDDIFATKKIAAKNAEEEQLAKKRKQASLAATKSSGASKSKSKLTYSRKDAETLTEKEWVDDGLGGKFNRDGYTGRVEGGVKVFKAHLFNQPNFGSSQDCPFDCECCFI